MVFIGNGVLLRTAVGLSIAVDSSDERGLYYDSCTKLLLSFRRARLHIYCLSVCLYPRI